MIVASTNLMIKNEVEIKPKKVMAASFDVNSFFNKRVAKLFILLFFNWLCFSIGNNCARQLSRSFIF